MTSWVNFNDFQLFLGMFQRESHQDVLKTNVKHSFHFINFCLM